MSYIAVATVRMNHRRGSLDPCPGGHMEAVVSLPVEDRGELDSIIAAWRASVSNPDDWTFDVCQAAPPIETA